MTDNAVRLTYPQYRAVRRLVHDCCNYDGGNCLLLDDGEECVCPQSIAYRLKNTQVYHDKILERLYASEEAYYRDLEETGGF